MQLMGNLGLDDECIMVMVQKYGVTYVVNEMKIFAEDPEFNKVGARSVPCWPGDVMRR
jgi:hypothetical protein